MTISFANQFGRPPPRVLPPPQGGWTRHLLYFLYPARSNTVWLRNVEQLLERIDLFNGSRTVALATDKDSEPAEAARAAFGSRDVTFIDVANHPSGESVGFAPLWRAVQQYTGPGDVTFYGHGKGVKHADPSAPAHAWASMMYAACLDYWPLVEREFCSRKSAVGAFRTPDEPLWHYSGTFFWFRNLVLAGRYPKAKVKWGSVELWPGKAFRYADSACLFEATPFGGAHYLSAYLKPCLDRFAEWSDANAVHRRAGALARPWEGKFIMAHADQTAFVAGVQAGRPDLFRNTRVVEIGSRDVNGSVRRFFTDCEYVGIDAVPGPGVDVVTLAHEYKPPWLADVVISCEALEHDPHWRETLRAAFSWLKPGGLFVGTWAGPNRPEHGTARTGGEYGPETDYYGNVSPAAFCEEASCLHSLTVSTGRGGQDVYACGRVLSKESSHGEEIPVQGLAGDAGGVQQPAEHGQGEGQGRPASPDDRDRSGEGAEGRRAGAEEAETLAAASPQRYTAGMIQRGLAGRSSHASRRRAGAG